MVRRLAIDGKTGTIKMCAARCRHHPDCASAEIADRIQNSQDYAKENSSRLECGRGRLGTEKISNLSIVLMTDFKARQHGLKTVLGGTSDLGTGQAIGCRDLRHRAKTDRGRTFDIGLAAKTDFGVRRRAVPLDKIGVGNVLLLTARLLHIATRNARR